jgi:hypothetical protein
MVSNHLHQQPTASRISASEGATSRTVETMARASNTHHMMC